MFYSNKFTRELFKVRNQKMHSYLKKGKVLLKAGVLIWLGSVLELELLPYVTIVLDWSE